MKPHSSKNAKSDHTNMHTLQISMTYTKSGGCRRHHLHFDVFWWLPWALTGNRSQKLPEDLLTRLLINDTWCPRYLSLPVLSKRPYTGPPWWKVQCAKDLVLMTSMKKGTGGASCWSHNLYAIGVLILRDNGSIYCTCPFALSNVLETRPADLSAMPLCCPCDQAIRLTHSTCFDIW